MRPPMSPPVVVLTFVLLSPAPSFAQCLLDGSYVSTPAAAYTCAFGLVSWNVQSWNLTISGGQIAVNPVPPGTLPAQLVGTIDCQTGTFSASASIPAGGCTETYTLSGQVQSVAGWTGNFLAQYSGSSCGLAGCVLQNIPVAGALPPTGITPGAGVPSLASLGVGPNPLGETTTLRVQLDRQQFASLVIHDVSGRVVATIVPGQWLDSGEHRYRWERRNRADERVPAGIYFVRLQVGAAERVAKLVVLN